jgi:hypothetical protein
MQPNLSERWSVMGFKELKKEFDDAMKDDLLFASGEDAATAENNFRYWLVRLLFEINGNLDSLAATYREVLKIQKERAK